MWNNHTTKALPCINTQQTAAKSSSKDQQPLLSAHLNAAGPPVNYQEINLSQVTKVGKNDCAYKVLTKAYELIGYRVNFTIFPGKRALIESNSGQIDGETASIAHLETQYPNLVRVPVAIFHMN